MSRTIGTVLAVCVTMPIWYYLLYSILRLVGATELMWFLFWVYLPVNLLTHVLSRLAEPGKAK
jgi:hypothetical protein